MASTLLSPMVDYYNDEEELDSVEDDDDRSFRGRDSEEGNVTNQLTKSSGSVYLLENKRKRVVIAWIKLNLECSVSNNLWVNLDWVGFSDTMGRVLLDSSFVNYNCLSPMLERPSNACFSHTLKAFQLCKSDCGQSHFCLAKKHFRNKWSKPVKSLTLLKL